jgi:DNA-binding MarR family transcriptional regulator
VVEPAEVADDRREGRRHDRLVERGQQQHEHQREEDQADARLPCILRGHHGVETSIILKQLRCAIIPLMARSDPAQTILDELSGLVRELSRISGGPDDAPPMTATQRLALFELSGVDALRLNDLAQRMGVSAPTASRAVDVLAGLGLVERVVDPADRRAVRIAPTPRGRTLVEERKARVYEAFRPAAAALPASDRRELARLLARLAGELRGT